MSVAADAARPAAVIAIDGPSGSGKSTIAARVAARLGIRWLSSGALYRAVTRMALDRLGSAGAHDGLVALVRSVRWTLIGAAVFADGRELTARLHSTEVDGRVAQVSAVPAVRDAVNHVLRARVAGECWVVEGRDIGTEVFPSAVVKVFLDASPVVRAERRALQRGSEAAEAGQIAAELAERDRRDRRKAMGALRPAAAAKLIDTSHLTVGEVCEIVVSVIPTKFLPE